MKTAKILVQKSETGLSEDNKAKLKSLKIYKDKKHFKFSNGWVDLAYELGKNIEEVCKLANCELPKIEAMYNKYNTLRVDYHFTSPVPKIVETLIDIPQSLKDTAMKKGFPLFSSTPGYMFVPFDGDPFKDNNK